MPSIFHGLEGVASNSADEECSVMEVLLDVAAQ